MPGHRKTNRLGTCPQPRKYGWYRPKYFAARVSRIEMRVVRHVLASGVDAGKIAHYEKDMEKAGYKHSVHIITPYLPKHDFLEDYRFLFFSDPLNGPSIEIAKAMSLGEDLNGAVERVLTDTPDIIRKRAFEVCFNDMCFQLLVDYLTELVRFYHSPETFGPLEIIDAMIMSARAAPVEKKFSMYREMIDLFGMEDKLRKHAHRFIEELEGEAYTAEKPLPADEPKLPPKEDVLSLAELDALTKGADATPTPVQETASGQ